MPFHVELVSPEQVLFEGEADMVVARTVGGGDIAFLTGHAPFLGALDIWQLKVQLTEGDDQVFAVHGGFVQVSDDRVTVLSDVAETPEQIDGTRAQQAREAAERAVQEAAEDERQLAEANKALRRADLRLEIVQQFAKAL